ncbi:MAG: AlpA family phage regulatory protein [Chloroflexi bacterium]|nr:AlpA family phage regulatory protein [Chloroflexota bacterium]
MNDTSRILRRGEVLALTGLSKSLMYEMRARGDFPSPIRLSKRAVGWYQTEIIEWMASRPTATKENLQ